jgi:hypothetical protein
MGERIMSQWKKVAPFAALSLSMAITAAGCVAPGSDDPMDEQAASPSAGETSTATIVDPQHEETVGEAHQAWDGFRALTASLFVDGIFPFLPGPFPFLASFAGCGGCGGCF